MQETYKQVLNELDQIGLQQSMRPKELYKILQIKRFVRERIYILTKEKWTLKNL